MFRASTLIYTKKIISGSAGGKVFAINAKVVELAIFTQECKSVKECKIPWKRGLIGL